MRIINCNVHGISEKIMTDSVLLRYECKHCLEDKQDEEEFHYRDELFELED